LQTATHYPDIAIGFIQQFALSTSSPYKERRQHYPINAAYGSGMFPAELLNRVHNPSGQGLAFNDASSNNIALATRIINAKISRGFYFFLRPWRLSEPAGNIKTARGYN